MMPMCFSSFNLTLEMLIVDRPSRGRLESDRPSRFNLTLEMLIVDRVPPIRPSLQIYDRFNLTLEMLIVDRRLVQRIQE